jgi:hypothetical protein
MRRLRNGQRLVVSVDEQLQGRIAATPHGLLPEEMEEVIRALRSAVRFVRNLLMSRNFS